MTEHRLKLGDRVRDKITGFTGIFVARTEWLNGCERVTIQPEKLDAATGKPRDDCTFDEPGVELVQEGVITTQPDAPPGGPNRGERRLARDGGPPRGRAKTLAGR